MLTSQLGIAMNTHFCGEIAVKSALTIGEEHLDCGMATMDRDCESDDTNHDNLSSQSCCKNLHQVLRSDDNFKNQVSEIQLSPTFLVVFVHAYLNALEEIHENKNKFFFESPPPVTTDIQVLYQTFLI